MPNLKYIDQIYPTVCAHSTSSPEFGIPSVIKIIISLLLSGSLFSFRSLISICTPVNTASLIFVPRRKTQTATCLVTGYSSIIEEIKKTFGIKVPLVILLTSIVGNSPHVVPGLIHIFLGSFAKWAPPRSYLVVKRDQGKVVLLVEVFEDFKHCLSCLQRITRSEVTVCACARQYIRTRSTYRIKRPLTCAIFLPLIDPLLSITNTTFFGSLSRSGGAKKCTKYPFTIWREDGHDLQGMKQINHRFINIF